MELTRRRFLVDGTAVTALLPLLPLRPGPLLRGALRRREDERVLVVVQLSGGNDALNTLVPFTSDAYHRARPTLALSTGGLHRLDERWALHAEAGDLAELFREGRAAIVHAVGYPRPDRSHFRSMEIWHTADPDRPAGGPAGGPAGDRGWLGRMADAIVERRPSALAAIHLGHAELPLALRGRRSVAWSVGSEDAFDAVVPHPAYRAWRARLLEVGGGDRLERFLRDTASTAYAAAEEMRELALRPDGAAYPSTELAKSLRLAARMIAGGLGARVFHVELDGFDTHARQAVPHAALLGELSRALGAFQRDLAKSGVADRVVTLVFSEFGRRFAENASRGTDHGAAAPLFLLGTGLRPGFHGAEPDLERLVDGDVATGVDFRSVYGALERDWMGTPASSGLDPLDLISG